MIHPSPNAVKEFGEASFRLTPSRRRRISRELPFTGNEFSRGWKTAGITRVDTAAVAFGLGLNEESPEFLRVQLEESLTALGEGPLTQRR